MIKVSLNAREMVTYEREFEFATKKERDEFLTRLRENCKEDNILYASDYFAVNDIVDGDGIELDDLTVSENNKDITNEVLEV